MEWEPEPDVPKLPPQEEEPGPSGEGEDVPDTMRPEDDETQEEGKKV